MRTLLFSLATWFLCSLAALGADEPQKPASRTIGSVYGKAVTAADVELTGPIDTTIKFDSRDRALWDQMGRIQRALGGPILERFVKNEKIEATADEIKKFQDTSRELNKKHLRDWEAKLAELKKELAAPNLSNEDKAKLEKEQAMYQRSVASMNERDADDLPAEPAKQFIVAWKIERELHRKYGGRVIFQQAGLEALDARRLLCEEAEKNGDLKFDDPDVRHLFYYYANMKHVGGSDASAFEKPWFFEPAK